MCKCVGNRKKREEPEPVLGVDGVMLADARQTAELPKSYLASIISVSKRNLQRGSGSRNMVRGKLQYWV